MSVHSTESALAEHVPSEVVDLARELGIKNELDFVLATTIDLFEFTSVAVRVEEDPEIPGDKYFVFETRAQGDVDNIVARHEEWHRRVPELPELRPGLFRLSIDAR